MSIDNNINSKTTCVDKSCKRTPCFYNPRRSTPRELTISFLREIFGSSIRDIALDAMAATGVSGIGWLSAGLFREVVFNDISRTSQGCITGNLSANGYNSVVYGIDISRDHIPGDYDYIEIDPYGYNPVYLENLLNSLNPDGIISISYTDFRSHSNPMISINKYGYVLPRGWINRPDLVCRRLIRDVLSGVQRHGRNLMPIGTYIEKDYIKVFYLSVPYPVEIHQPSIEEYMKYGLDPEDFPIWGGSVRYIGGDYRLDSGLTHDILNTWGVPTLRINDLSDRFNLIRIPGTDRFYVDSETDITEFIRQYRICFYLGVRLISRGDNPSLKSYLKVCFSELGQQVGTIVGLNLLNQIYVRLTRLPQQALSDYMKGFPSELHVEETPWEYFFNREPFPQIDQIVMRFAPSPSGPLHLGHSRVLFTHEILRRRYPKSHMILRVEDTNLEHKYPLEEIVDTILDTFTIDEVIFQGERLELYNEYMVRLFESPNFYFCNCPADLRTNLARDLKPCIHYGQGSTEKWTIYKNISRDIEAAEYYFKGINLNAKFEGEFDIPISRVQDGIWRPLMNFAVVVDDYELGVNVSIRGVDHESNEYRQAFIRESLRIPAPAYNYYLGKVSYGGRILSASKLSPDSPMILSNYLKMDPSAFDKLFCTWARKGLSKATIALSDGDLRLPSSREWEIRNLLHRS